MQIGLDSKHLPASDPRPRWRQWLDQPHRVERALSHFAGQHGRDPWHGNPPMDNFTHTYRPFPGSTDPHVVAIIEDGREVWLGTPHRWHHHMTRPQFHAIIRWYIHRHVFHDWCGLRTSLYFWLLHRRVGRTLELAGIKEDMPQE